MAADGADRGGRSGGSGCGDRYAWRRRTSECLVDDISVAHANSYADSHSNADSDSNADTDSDANAKSESVAESDSIAHSDSAAAAAGAGGGARPVGIGEIFAQSRGGSTAHVGHQR